MRSFVKITVMGIDTLREYVQRAVPRSFVPYSRQPRAVLVLMSNGDWICGVRVENASYSLTIPALTSALVSAASIGRHDVAAIVFSGQVKQEEKTAVLQSVHTPMQQLDEDVLGQPGASFYPHHEISTCQHFSNPIDTSTGIGLARRATEFSYTPESNFPVGAIVVTDDNRYFQGANIEHPDWTRILCAERVAIASAVSAGAKNIQTVFISSPKSKTPPTPCGACRQVLYEIAPKSIVWMDHDRHTATCLGTLDLLPNPFVLSESQP